MNYPHAGAVVQFLRGRRGDLPPHVVLPETMGRGGGNLPNGQAGGFLGKAYDPFALMADPSKPDFKVPDLLPPSSLGDVRIDRRRRMREAIEGQLTKFETTENAKMMDANFQSAYQLMSSPQARAAFDLSKEPTEVRERYGMNRFGQCCLLARRLVEAGVRFVTINTFLTVFDEITWDIHGSKPFTSIEGMKNIVAPMYDQGYAALIGDLFERGTPRHDTCYRISRIRPHTQSEPSRWTRSLAAMLLGNVCGSRCTRWSRGRRQRPDWRAVPADRPASPAEVVATIFHALGLDLSTELSGPAGRPIPIVDFGIREIRELFA